MPKVCMTYWVKSMTEKIDKNKLTYDQVKALVENMKAQPSFNHIYEDIQRNYWKFSPDEISNLRHIAERRKAYFEPRNCRQVKEIRMWYTNPSFTVGKSDGKAWALCQEAKDAGMSLYDYIMYLNSNGNAISGEFAGYTIETSVNTRAYEEPEIRKTLNEKYVGRTIRRNIRMAEEEAEELGVENRVEVDMAGLIRQYKADMEELMNEIKIGNQKRIDELNEKINRLTQEIKLNQGEEINHVENAVKEEEKGPEITEVKKTLNYYEYRWLISHAFKFRLPVRYEQVGKGYYNVTVMVKNENEKERAENMISQAEKEGEVKKEVRVKKYYPGYDDILNDLCIAYEKEAKKSCGLSRTGALSTLANNLAEYCSTAGIDYQSVDFRSMDIFAKYGEIYTSEQAGEALKNFINSEQGKYIAAKYKENEPENDQECEENTLMGPVTDYDTVLILKEKYNISNDELKAMMDKAVDALKECDYYPNRLDEVRTMIDRYLSQYGSDYDTELEATVERLRDKYENVR